MNTEVENFLASNTYTDATKDTYRSVLEELADNLISEWTASDLLSFVQKKNWGNSRQYVALCASRKFISFTFGVNHPALKARLKRIRPKKGRSLNLNKINELLASFNPFSPIGARDLALAALAIDTGLRASELARIQLDDVDLENRTLQVIVKGGQWAMAVYSPETVAFLDRWLAYRTPADGVNSLFISLRQSADHGQQLKVYGIKSIFKKWTKTLGWKISPHDARRTFGNVTTNLGSPQAISMAAGRWHDAKSFQRYTLDVMALGITPYLPITHALKDKS